jgi:hypothetical protein
MVAQIMYAHVSKCKNDKIGGGQGGEMTQTMYAHVNKIIKKKKG